MVPGVVVIPMVLSEYRTLSITGNYFEIVNIYRLLTILNSQSDCVPNLAAQFNLWERRMSHLHILYATFEKVF